MKTRMTFFITSTAVVGQGLFCLSVKSKNASLEREIVVDAGSKTIPTYVELVIVATNQAG
jgi:hypothetical protein